MVSVPLFEGVCCHADVVFSGVCVICGNCCLVNYVVCQALASERALILVSAVAVDCVFMLRFAFPKYV